MNPDVLNAFALAIVASGQGPAYPGVPNHEPNVTQGRKATDEVHRSMTELRAIPTNVGTMYPKAAIFRSDGSSPIGAAITRDWLK